MVGRKPLKVVATTIRLPAGVAAKIDAAAGRAGARASFIRKAVDAALAKGAAAEKAKAKPKRAKPAAAPAVKPKADAGLASRNKRPAAAKLTRARPKPRTAARRLAEIGAAVPVPIGEIPLL